MPANAISTILGALTDSRVRYVVVGGVAVVLHGHLRFTADLDLVIALDRDNVLAALSALKRLGFQPRSPVPADQFADPEVRATWIREKGLTVFSLWGPDYPGTDVDLFAEEPIPFEDLSGRAQIADLSGRPTPIASIPDLIAMKRKAGRPTDLEDIAALEEIALSLEQDEEDREGP